MADAVAERRISYCRRTTHIARTRRLDLPCSLSPRRTVKSRCDPSWVSQVRANVEPGIDADRDHIAHRHLSGPGMWPGGGAVHGVRRAASPVLRSDVRAAGATSSAAGGRANLPARPARSDDARDAPATVPHEAKESDASLGSDFGERNSHVAESRAPVICAKAVSPSRTGSAAAKSPGTQSTTCRQGKHSESAEPLAGRQGIPAQRRQRV